MRLITDIYDQYGVQVTVITQHKRPPQIQDITKPGDPQWHRLLFASMKYFPRYLDIELYTLAEVRQKLKGCQHETQFSWENK